MAVYRDVAIVLSSRDLGEADKILVLFGRRSGKFSVVAKGVRKLSSRKRGHLETCSLSKVSCAEGRNLDVLVEAESIFVLNADDIGTARYERLSFAAYVTKQFLAENVPEGGIFDWWAEYIASDHSEKKTVEYVCYVLDQTGFLTKERREKLVLHDGKDLSRLRRYVERVVETA